MKNVLDRYVPDEFKPYTGQEINVSDYHELPVIYSKTKNKMVKTISEVFDKVGITNGATLSFHHHLRNGDEVMNMVLAEVKKRDLKNITLAPSAIFPNIAIISELIENGNVTKIYTNYLNGSVAKTITDILHRKPHF